MNPDLLLSIAESKNAALVLSLFVNGLLLWALLKIYRAKELLQQEMIKLLREIIPLALKLSEKLESMLQ